MAQQVTTSQRLIHNTLFNVVTLVSNAIVAFLLVRFFLGRLGEAGYGIWVLVGSIFRYRGILNMGLNSAINRDIPVCLVRNDEEGIRKVISTALFYYSALGAVLAMVTFLLYAKVSDWFAIEPEMVTTAGRLVLIVGVGFAIASPLQLTTAVLSGLQRYDIINVATWVTLAMRTILLVVLLLQGWGLLTMGLIFGASEIGMRTVQYLFIRRLLPHVSISRRYVDRNLLKAMLFYGVNTLLYSTGALVMYQASSLVIGVLLSTGKVAQFAVPTAAVLLMSQLLQAFAAAVKPAVSELDARDDHSKVKEIAFLTQKYSLLLIIPAAGFFIFMGREFLNLWVGDKFANPDVIDTLAAILIILTVAHSLRLAQHSNFVVLVGRGEHRVFGVLTALAAVVCVVSSVLAVLFLGWDLLGIAWCNFVPVALLSGVVLPVYFRRRMEISAKESFRRVLRPALIGSLPALILIGLWKLISPPASWPALLAAVGSTIVVTLAWAWFFSLQPRERRHLRAVVVRPA
jgi:O-antigen/teichoic acid export membrane protein